MSTPQIETVLRALLEGVEVRTSRLSPKTRRDLRELLDLGVVSTERSGRAHVMLVKHHDALRAFAERNYPSLIYGSTPGLSPRAEAVEARRNSKAGRKLEATPLMLRGFHGATLTQGDKHIDVAHATQAGDISAFVLSDNAPHWDFNGVLTLVENQEVFLHLEKAFAPTELILWYHGVLPERVIKWVHTISAKEIYFSGDFDPMGFDNYCRLRRGGKRRIPMLVPEFFEDCLRKHGASHLLQPERSKNTWTQVRSDPPTELIPLIEEMFHQHKALEEEVLLHPSVKIQPT